jgi:hypothetical protein
VAAQAPGLPVHGGGFRQGTELVATIGWAGESSFTGDATTYGFGVSYGSGQFGVNGTLGVLNHATDGSGLTLGTMASWVLLGNGVDTPFELAIFTGYGWFDRPGPAGSVLGSWRVPFGGSVALAITTPFASIRPWLAPRGEIFRLTSGGEQENKTRLAGSAGVDLRFPGGPGLRVMWDQVDGFDSTLGVGLSYRF